MVAYPAAYETLKKILFEVCVCWRLSVCAQKHAYITLGA